MHDVEFEVFPNEVVALVGGNGAGKSTLLEHLNATLVPDEGELIVGGTLISEDNKAHARKEVGFVFQDADTQLVAPTVLDDVMFGLRNYGVPTDEAKDRARKALAMVNATHLEERIPHYLSGGEKRLVGLAGVLVLNPSVVVLDEPLAGLDPERSHWSPTAFERFMTTASASFSRHICRSKRKRGSMVTATTDNPTAALFIVRSLA